MAGNVADLRREYTAGGLRRADLAEDPIAQFGHWFEQALSAEVPDANAMTLTTCTRDGVPSGRIVLLKGFDERGFTFFTSYLSPKSKELEANPNAAMVFYWQPLDRQVRIAGTVTRTSEEESEAYFQSRPRGSQLGAWASEQSSVVADRAALESRFAEMEAKYPDRVPRPQWWGGFRLAPRTVEFWQGRASRLHDRLQYVQQNGAWIIQRISP